MEKLERRLNKIGINIELIGNYPWIYLQKVNNKVVREKKYSDYGYTIAFMPVRLGNKIKLIDINETFKIIRKYCKE